MFSTYDPALAFLLVAIFVWGIVVFSVWAWRWCRHHHRWQRISVVYTTSTLTSIEGKVPVDRLRELAFGITNMTYRCIGCGDEKVTTHEGRVVDGVTA